MFRNLTKCLFKCILIEAKFNYINELISKIIQNKVK